MGRISINNMYSFFLGFDSQRLKSSFNYAIKNALIDCFVKNNISYTLDINDDFKEAIVPSGTDYFSFYAALKKKNVKVNVIATNAVSDFYIKKIWKGRELTLSLDAINYYKKADHLLVYLESQKELIEKNKISTPIELIPILTPDYEDAIGENYPLDCFLSNYQIQKGREIIVSYGILTKKETVMDMRAIARNCPEKEFIFFGEISPDALKQKLLEGVTQPKNIHFYKNLPEALYPSFLKHCNKLLLLGDYLAYPQIMIDCIYRKIPIITYKLSGYDEILNSNDVHIAKTYSSLYDAVNKPIDEKKVENAYQSLIKSKNDIRLNTYKEKTTIL